MTTVGSSLADLMHAQLHPAPPLVLASETLVAAPSEGEYLSRRSPGLPYARGTLPSSTYRPPAHGGALREMLANLRDFQ